MTSACLLSPSLPHTDPAVSYSQDWVDTPHWFFPQCLQMTLLVVLLIKLQSPKPLTHPQGACNFSSIFSLSLISEAQLWYVRRGSPNSKVNTLPFQALCTEHLHFPVQSWLSLSINFPGWGSPYVLEITHLTLSRFLTKLFSSLL